MLDIALSPRRTQRNSHQKPTPLSRLAPMAQTRMNAAHYSAIERLADGASLEVRALKPSDRAAMLAAIGRSISEALHRRFFLPKRSFGGTRIDFLLNVDFKNHVALAAVIRERGTEVIGGGARYVMAGTGCAEVSLLVDDPHQKGGIAACLIAHLVSIGRGAGIKEFIVEVLPENLAMLKVFKRCGLSMTARCQRGITHVTLDLSPRNGDDDHAARATDLLHGHD
jgi:RimJ/RimL family protein N-acetyltransferase